MSLVNLAHVCSHLQNASLARLGLTSIPYTKWHLSLALLLQKQGFLSQVKLGGPSPPASCFGQGPRDDHTVTNHPHGSAGRNRFSSEAALAKMVRQHWTPSQLHQYVTQANRASRRLWLGLKYYQSSPVLSKAKMISKPTKRIWLSSRDLANVVRGSNAGEVKPLTQIGEIMAVSTDRGIMEARECVERRIGGQPLCRVW
ncbi:hypothetical protein DOTSEDRAFT_162851 [Dothistroma septosporum NZE10]|uniref:Ribosomal protein S8 n=1 Tax=Dothistroma septosporum (strain NZE10 / CBS 128990) TaxID=675120 RepID=N1Q2Q4_DOTSN|nr:hypothetical protein DOTSEDRAFT_162851 [Dothistroma septosporum NZE10]